MSSIQEEVEQRSGGRNIINEEIGGSDTVSQGGQPSKYSKKCGMARAVILSQEGKQEETAISKSHIPVYRSHQKALC